MKRWFLVPFYLLFFLTAKTARADQCAPIRDYTQVTRNGSYILVMLARSTDELPFCVYTEGEIEEVDEIRGKYHEAGLYRNDGSTTPLWTIDWFAYSVDVASDGRHLVRWGPWANTGEYEELAVAFYEDGKEIKRYRIRDLVAEPQKLPESASHLKWRLYSNFDDRRGRLTIITLNNERYTFDIRSGEILTKSQPTSTTPSPTEDAIQSITPTSTASSTPTSTASSAMGTAQSVSSITTLLVGVSLLLVVSGIAVVSMRRRADG